MPAETERWPDWSATLDGRESRPLARPENGPHPLLRPLGELVIVHLEAVEAPGRSAIYRIEQDSLLKVPARASHEGFRREAVVRASLPLPLLGISSPQPVALQVDGEWRFCLEMPDMTADWSKGAALGSTGDRAALLVRSSLSGAMFLRALHELGFVAGDFKPEHTVPMVGGLFHAICDLGGVVPVGPPERAPILFRDREHTPKYAHPRFSVETPRPSHDLHSLMVVLEELGAEHAGLRDLAVTLRHRKEEELTSQDVVRSLLRLAEENDVDPQPVLSTWAAPDTVRCLSGYLPCVSRGVVANLARDVLDVFDVLEPRHRGTWRGLAETLCHSALDADPRAARTSVDLLELERDLSNRHRLTCAVARALLAARRGSGPRWVERVCRRVGLAGPDLTLTTGLIGITFYLEHASVDPVDLEAVLFDACTWASDVVAVNGEPTAASRCLAVWGIEAMRLVPPLVELRAGRMHPDLAGGVAGLLARYPILVALVAPSRAALGRVAGELAAPIASVLDERGDDGVDPVWAEEARIVHERWRRHH